MLTLGFFHLFEFSRNSNHLQLYPFLPSYCKVRLAQNTAAHLWNVNIPSTNTGPLALQRLKKRGTLGRKKSLLEMKKQDHRSRAHVCGLKHHSWFKSDSYSQILCSNICNALHQTFVLYFDWYVSSVQSVLLCFRPLGLDHGSRM